MDAYVVQEQAHLVFLADSAASNPLKVRIGDVILDIGATSTIAGAASVAAYIARLPPSTRSLITFVEAAAVFPGIRGRQLLHLFVDASSVKAGMATAHTGFGVFSTSAPVPAGPMAPNALLKLLLYTSHRQSCVTHSTFAAEVYALLEVVREVLELAAIHAHIHTGDEYALPPIDAYADKLFLYNTLDAHSGVVQPTEVGAAAQMLHEVYRGTIATITWLSARGQLADALTKSGRDTPLQQTIKTVVFGVRLAESDYLTKSSPAAPRTEAERVRLLPATETSGDGRM